AATDMTGRGDRARVAALIAIVAAAAVTTACRARGGTTPAPVDEERGRFPHARHAQIACTECHQLEAVLAGRPARPGAADHAPCDRSGCHRDEFLARPGRLCRMCHAAVAPGVA